MPAASRIKVGRWDSQLMVLRQAHYGIGLSSVGPRSANDPNFFNSFGPLKLCFKCIRHRKDWLMDIQGLQLV